MKKVSITSKKKMHEWRMKNLSNKKMENCSEHNISYLVQQSLRPALQCSKERVENLHGLEAKVRNVRRELFKENVTRK